MLSEYSIYDFMDEDEFDLDNLDQIGDTSDAFEHEELLFNADIFGDELNHYGTPHDGTTPHSGRFEYGSGEFPGQHNHDLYLEVRQMQQDAKKKGEKLTPEECYQMYMSKHEKETMKVSDFKLKYASGSNYHRYAERKKYFAYKSSHPDASRNEIYIATGIKPSTQASFENKDSADKLYSKVGIYDSIKKQVDRDGYVDVGEGSFLFLPGASEHSVGTAVRNLLDEGYEVHNLKVDQLNTSFQTTYKVLCKPGTTWEDAMTHKFDIKQLGDMNKTIDIDGYVAPWTPVECVDSKRVYIRYAEDGGKDKDGLIELRPGVPDISLNKANYAQVRIGVDDKYFMKGMAVYSDDIPEGYDIVYNSNKHVGAAKDAVFKKMQVDDDGNIDKDNPFKTTIKEDKDLILTSRYYRDPKTGEKKLSKICVVNEEGTWDKWNKTTAVQMLSKQPTKLVQQQLALKYADTKTEFEEICQLNNPTLKKHLLAEFASKCDADAVEMAGAPFIGQKSAALLPFTDIKPDELYCSWLPEGADVCLVRYPLASNAEIPVLKVKNHGTNAEKIIGAGRDAIGVHPQTEAQMSGADNDGDTALVIPYAKSRIGLQTAKPLKDLIMFEPKDLYTVPGLKDAKAGEVVNGVKKQQHQTYQTAMGKVSNLITDMTAFGASPEQTAPAIKVSMVVIDAEKHGLDYQQAWKDYGIDKLSREWQKKRGNKNGGAATIMSRSTGEIDIPERKMTSGLAPVSMHIDKDGKPYQRGNVDSKTGEMVYYQTGEVVRSGKLKSSATLVGYTKSGKPKYEYEKVWVNKDKKGYYYNEGKGANRKKVYVTEDDFVGGIVEKAKTQKIERGYMVKDAYELTSGGGKGKGHPTEDVYAEHSNRMRALANNARLEYLATKSSTIDKEVQKEYKDEIDSLKAKVLAAKENKPRERAASLLANQWYRDKIYTYPNLDKEHKKKLKRQAVTAARAIVGAQKPVVDITPREWEAIQRGAVSTNIQEQVFANCDPKQLRQYATPRVKSNALLSAQKARIICMLNSYRSGNTKKQYTLAEIAEAAGVSTATVSEIEAEIRKGGDGNVK